MWMLVLGPSSACTFVAPASLMISLWLRIEAINALCTPPCKCQMHYVER